MELKFILILREELTIQDIQFAMGNGELKSRELVMDT